jgi:hypothetical protein
MLFGALLVLILFAGNSQLLHSGLQRCPFQTQSCRRSGWPAQHSAGFSQHANNGLAPQAFQRAIVEEVLRGQAQFARGSAQYERIPLFLRRFTTEGKRISAFTSGTTCSCWVCQAIPLGVNDRNLDRRAGKVVVLQHVQSHNISPGIVEREIDDFIFSHLA